MRERENERKTKTWKESEQQFSTEPGMQPALSLGIWLYQEIFSGVTNVETGDPVETCTVNAVKWL